MSKSEEGYLGIVTDTTKDMLQKRQMQYENTHDALTGLCKFGYFKQLAEGILHKLPHGEVCAFVMLDLDYFKPINDTFTMMPVTGTFRVFRGLCNPCLRSIFYAQGVPGMNFV